MLLGLVTSAFQVESRCHSVYLSFNHLQMLIYMSCCIRQRLTYDDPGRFLVMPILPLVGGTNGSQ